MRNIPCVLLPLLILTLPLRAHENLYELHQLDLSPNPATFADHVTAVFSGTDPSIISVGPPVREGNTVRIEVFKSSVPITPPPTSPFLHEVDLGTFPAGSEWAVEFLDDQWIYAGSKLTIHPREPRVTVVPEVPFSTEEARIVLEGTDRCAVLGPLKRRRGQVFEVELSRGCIHDPPLPLEPYRFEISLGILESQSWSFRVLDADSGEEVVRRSFIVANDVPILSVQPSAPTSAEPVTLQLTVIGGDICPLISDIQFNGHFIDVTFEPDCILPPPPIFPAPTSTEEAPLGTLAAAPYRLRLFNPEGELLREFPFVVSPSGRCETDSDSLCLLSGRFEVKATWRTEAGAQGTATPELLTDDSGRFWFFDRSNTEVVLKVVDACGPPFDRFWVFASGLTNLQVDLTVRDLESGEIQRYGNPLGQAFRPILDTTAFATCP